MPRFYLLIGMISLSLLGYADYRGYGLFDDTSSTTHSRGPSGRTSFHK